MLTGSSPFLPVFTSTVARRLVLGEQGGRKIGNVIVMNLGSCIEGKGLVSLDN